jgi:hypothetical protein
MGVITMKMISNTNITSTIGVTLMLELTLTPSFRLLNAITHFSSAVAYLPPELSIIPQPLQLLDLAPGPQDLNLAPVLLDRRQTATLRM